MKTQLHSAFRIPHFALLLALLSTLNSQLSTAHAQGTAFTYQGQLFDNGVAANGNYAMQFTLYTNATSALNVLAGPLTLAPVTVSNGLFTVLLDFGPGEFTGPPRWLQIYAATNSVSPPYLPLTPRQLLSPTPYAIFANTASNLSGTLPTAQLSGTVNNGQLTYSGITVSAGPGMSVGGIGTLGTTVTLTNTGVLSVGGNGDITATPSSGNVILGDNATSANSTNTLMKRDNSGSFAAANEVLNGNLGLNGNLNLAATTASAGIIYSGGSLFVHSYGINNFFAGLGAGNLTMSGGRNSGIGSGALQANTSAFDNTADGYQALYNNTSGSNNTANGSQALYSNSTGYDNTASGFQALYNNTSGFENTANGNYALYLNTIGVANTAIGDSALFHNLIGSANTAVGAGALASNTNGGGNTANGYDALGNNTSGNGNTASGQGALTSNTIGSENTASGFDALFSNKVGSNNVANGYEALFANINGLANTANGYEALYSNTNGNDNTANGYQALFSNTSGTHNTANGREALYNNTGGGFNTANGQGALYNNTNAYYCTANGFDALFYNNANDNTADGYEALFHNTSGLNNSATGFKALFSNTIGSNNTASGYQALYNNYADDNTAIGFNALQANTSGANNTASGYLALFANVSGGQNTASGVQALNNNTNGSGNTAFGFNALQVSTGNNNTALGTGAGQNNTTGSYNIDIGNAGGSGDDSTIRIGDVQTKTYIAGISLATVSGNPVLVAGNGQLGLAPSSRRYKDNIQSMAGASDVLLSLRPVTFRYKADIDPKGTPQFGLIAEEVDKVDPDLVLRDNKNQVFTVRYEAVNAMLLNEFQKEHKKVEDQATEIENLKQQLAATRQEMATRLDRLEKAVARVADNAETTLVAR